MSPGVRLGGAGGTWLSGISGIEVDTRWPLGGYQLDFNVLLEPGQRPSVIAEDVQCDLMRGGVPIFPGQISEPNWDEGKVTAIGMARVPEKIPALIADQSMTTSTPDTAIDTAISLGWNVTRPASLSSVAMQAGDATGDMNMTAALLDLWAGDSGKSWYVDSYRAVRSGIDPTVPELYILPGAGTLSWAKGDAASKIIGLWQDSGGNKHVTRVGTGTNVRAVDLTTRGALNTTTATNILNAILARALQGSWANSITVASDQIITPGWLHPSLARVSQMVGRGVMVRLLGHRDPRPGRSSLLTDVVLGQAVWNVDDGTIALTPVGAVARDFSSIVESFGGTVAA